MKLSLALGVNEHNVAWHVCDSIKVPSGACATSPARAAQGRPAHANGSAAARPPSHSPTSRQTYKPDEGVALTNEQRVTSIHHDERVELTGRGTT